MSAHAAALWATRCAAGHWPRADCYGLGEPLPADFAGHSLIIDLRDSSRLRIDSIGVALAAVFELKAGPLPDGPSDGLSHWLRAACRTLTVRRAPVPLEARLRTGAGEARLLARGILLPLADAQGKLGFAHAVVTWKELLEPSAAVQLQLEIAAAHSCIRGQTRDAFD